MALCMILLVAPAVSVSAIELTKTGDVLVDAEALMVEGGGEVTRDERRSDVSESKKRDDRDSQFDLVRILSSVSAICC